MSDENDEQVQIDPGHPWAVASTLMTPQPIPTGVDLESVEFSIEGGEPNKAGLLSLVDPTGVKTVFLTPQAVVYLHQASGEILQQWAEEENRKPKLIVANREMEKQARKMDQANRNLKGVD